jgi:formylglycine-generating enzyme required for sulfatase activity/serine/threonine protein kinase
MAALNPRPDQQFGRYRIVKRLGQGGMGSVYLAQDTHLERAVALKIPDFGKHEGPDARKRFLEEARTAATLDHPYLCRVYETGEIEGQPYLTMAYIEGQSLAALIGDEGWPQHQVAALVGKLALALQEAHTRKVIHRDLKPANVMIKTAGQRREPVIVDFGLARRDNRQDQRLTESGQVMGTLGYMAPEQIRGDLKEIGPACDIYALGVILYELLTGRLPFSGSGLAVAGQILTQAPLPPSTHRGDLDPALEAICLKAMARTVGDRYNSMGELATVLTGFLQSASANPAPMVPSCSPAPPSPISGERAKAAGSSSLVGQFLAQLAGTKGSPPSPNPEPGASRAPLPHRRRQRPWIVAAAVLSVPLLGAIIYVHRRDGGVGFQVIRGTRQFRNNEIGKLPPSPVAERPSPKPAVGLVEAQTVEAVDPRKAHRLAPDIPPKPIANSIGMKLALIPAGEFMMGMTPDASSEFRRFVRERNYDAGWVRFFDDQFLAAPKHHVTLTKPWLMGATEVTIGHFRKFVESTGYVTEAEQYGFGNSAATTINAEIAAEIKNLNWRTPGYAVTDDSPVTQVTWNDAVSFCNWLSEQEKLKPCYHKDARDGWLLLAAGEGYRLPTEAEWEYACQAGSTDEPTSGDDFAWLKEHAWFAGNPRGGPKSVAMKPPNAFRLFDMRGNVFEWCHDWSSREYYRKSPPNDPLGPSRGGDRVLRGGGWNRDAIHCHSGFRTYSPPSYRNDHFGFRVVRVTMRSPSVAGDTGGLPIDAEESRARPLVKKPPELPASTLAAVNAGDLPKPQPTAPDNPPKSVTNSIGMKLVLVPAGEFLMGSTDAEQPAGEHPALIQYNKPQHRVRITRHFFLSALEVTQDQYQEVMGANPSAFRGDPRLPVESVSWFDAIAFCNRLSLRDNCKPFYTEPTKASASVTIVGGDGYRLPTEAEWEYACRAGTTTRFSFGDEGNGGKLDDYVWRRTTSDDRTHPVGRKLPNAFGLYDMNGNVAEWCWDWFGKSYYGMSDPEDPYGPAEGSHRVVRGGSYHWNSAGVYTPFERTMRLNMAKPAAAKQAENSIGIRVARSAFLTHPKP